MQGISPAIQNLKLGLAGYGKGYEYLLKDIKKPPLT
jgi:hypothetical protein